MIKILDFREHSKASEKYVDVIFTYPDGSKWEGSIPIEYRRTGISAKSKEEIASLIKKAYDSMNPVNNNEWIKEQDEFWKG